jgi:hypothetical protein
MCNCYCHDKKNKKPGLSDNEKLLRRREAQREYYKRNRDSIIAKNNARYLKKQGKSDVEIQMMLKVNKVKRSLNEQLAADPALKQLNINN